MEKWAEQHIMLQGCCGGTKNKEASTKLLIERMLVAYDLTVAFDYMHSLHLLYRDIKPGTFFVCACVYMYD